MPIPVDCPSCHAHIRAPRITAGKRVKCPKCGHGVTVPAAPPPPKAAPPVPSVALPAPKLAVACGHCGGTMARDDRLAGQTVACPHCRQLITMPPAPGTVPVQPAALPAAFAAKSMPSQPPTPSPYAGLDDQDDDSPFRRRENDGPHQRKRGVSRGFALAVAVIIPTVLLLFTILVCVGVGSNMSHNNGWAKATNDSSQANDIPVKGDSPQTENPKNQPQFVGTWDTPDKSGEMVFKENGVYEFEADGQLVRRYWKVRDARHIEIRGTKDEKEDGDAVVFEYEIRSPDVLAIRMKASDEMHEMRRIIRP